MYDNEVYSEGKPAEVPAEQPATDGSNPYFDYTSHTEEELRRETETQGKTEKKPSRRRKERTQGGGTFRRLVVNIAMGVCFGACAAVAFFGVNRALDYFSPAETVQTGNADNASETMKVPTVGNVNASPSYVTYVQNDTSAMVDEVMPAMVSIVNNYTTMSFNFWGQTISRDNLASGSGIIVGQTDEVLLIATNNHVVADATKLEVTFIDGSKAEAVIKGTDAEMDLAVIAVSLSNLDADTKTAIAVAKLGDSSNLKLGEPVVAIGNALGYGQSVTTGCISALNRELEGEDGSVNTFIQTDAAINPGNSGGALLNINGEVIGINSSKIGGSSIEGMGYAIPISSASPILTELMEREVRDKVEYAESGYLGVQPQTVTDEISASLGLPKGIFIKEVVEGSAAEKAGVLKGDILVKLDGQKLSTADELRDLLTYYKAGEEVTVTVKRASGGVYESVELTVILDKRPE